MLQNLKIASQYDGLLFLADAVQNLPIISSHRHVELELMVVIRGTVTIVAKKERHTFPQRSLMWLFPAQEHQMVDHSNDALYYVAVFTPAMIKRSCRSKRYADLGRKRAKCDGILHSMLEAESFDLIRRNLDSMMTGALDSDTLNREAGFGFDTDSDFAFQHSDPDGLNAGLHYLLLLAWRCQIAGKAASQAVSLHPAVCKALELLGKEEQEQGLNQLARQCGVSEDYLGRTFHRQIGIPLSTYRNSLRLTRFWTHYKGPIQKTMTEAVYAAGFGSYAQFYNVFKKTYGRGPRACLNDAPRQVA